MLGKCLAKLLVIMKKEEVSFEQCQWNWRNAPSGSRKEAKALAMAKKKAQKFEEREWVLANTPRVIIEEDLVKK